MDLDRSKYGDLSAFGGKAPDFGRLWKGYDFLAKEYPDIDYVRTREHQERGATDRMYSGVLGVVSVCQAGVPEACALFSAICSILTTQYSKNLF